MVRAVGVAKAAGALAQTDRWVPLSVKWDAASGLDGPLYLFIRDPREGFVELKIDPVNGALIGFVIIDLPPAGTKASLDDLAVEWGTAIIALDMWPWTVTPDYREPAKRRLDLSLSLASSVDDEQLTIWLGDGQPAAKLVTDEVTITVPGPCEIEGIHPPSLACAKYRVPSDELAAIDAGELSLPTLAVAVPAPAGECRRVVFEDG